MIKFKREDIHLVNRYSNITKEKVDALLKENVYHDAGDWKKFLRMFFASLGTAFIITGIIFFFAYNWADLHKFVKLTLIESLIVFVTLVAAFSKIGLLYKNLMLTASSLLTGVLFAVFGQIYQTGANAYDFFLGWTLCITLWVLIADFAALWLIYIVLLNTTLVLYADQAARDWSGEQLFTLLILMNSIAFIGLMIYSKLRTEVKVPKWLLYTVALIAVSFATTGTVALITNGLYFSEYHPFTYWVPALVLLSLISLTATAIYGFKQKKIFYLALIALSVIINISAIILEIARNEGILLFLSIFIIASVTASIKQLISLKKKWEHE